MENKDWLSDKYWNEELSLEEIANICGVSTATIYRWMQKHNINRRSKYDYVKYKNKSYKNKQLLYQKYWQEELSTYKIAKICDTHEETIRRWMIKFNIPRRKPKEYTSGNKNGRFGKKCSRETKKKISRANKGRLSGANNPNWKGGHTIKHKEWRKKIFERDNYTCQKCLKRGDYIIPHHIIPWRIVPEERFEVSNGATLCESCHAYIHTVELQDYFHAVRWR